MRRATTSATAKKNVTEGALPDREDITMSTQATKQRARHTMPEEDSLSGINATCQQR